MYQIATLRESNETPGPLATIAAQSRFRFNIHRKANNGRPNRSRNPGTTSEDGRSFGYGQLQIILKVGQVEEEIPDGETIGRRIAELMDSTGISPRELASATGLHISTIYRIINGSVRPSAESTHRIELYYRLRTNDLDNEGEFARRLKRENLRGGKQSKRDQEFPAFEDDEIREWGHRIGRPKRNNGRGITDNREAERWKQIWQDEVNENKSVD